MTIPDHALTIRQIMERHTQQQLIEVKKGRYHDETGESEENIGWETGNIMERLDHQEIHEKAQLLVERQEERNAKDLKEKQEKQKKQLQEKLSARDKKLREQWENEQKTKQPQNPGQE